MSKKYIDELCRMYGKRDIKQLAYLAYVYHFSELCNMNINERWLLYEIGRNLKDDDLNYVLSFLESNDKEKMINRFANTMDYKRYGGALFLGVKKPVVKAHGSSDEKLFEYTIIQAEKFVENKAVDKMIEAFNK